jgi:hypothetical protein
MVSPVSQYADDLRGQRFIQQFDDGFSIRFVARRDRSIFDMLTRTITQSLDVGEKGLRFHVIFLSGFIRRCFRLVRETPHFLSCAAASSMAFSGV